MKKIVLLHQNGAGRKADFSEHHVQNAALTDPSYYRSPVIKVARGTILFLSTFSTAY